MRSGLIFRASDHISNRFLLCRMLAASARKMHRDGVSTSQSINESLIALHGVPADSPIEKRNATAEGLNADAAKVEETHGAAVQGAS